MGAGVAGGEHPLLHRGGIRPHGKDEVAVAHPQRRAEPAVIIGRGGSQLLHPAEHVDPRQAGGRRLLEGGERVGHRGRVRVVAIEVDLPAAQLAQFSSLEQLQTLQRQRSQVATSSSKIAPTCICVRTEPV